MFAPTATGIIYIEREEIILWLRHDGGFGIRTRIATCYFHMNKYYLPRSCILHNESAAYVFYTDIEKDRTKIN